MKLVKVAAAALNQTPLDWDGNRANILAAIAAAKDEKVDLLCLPELCVSGYGCEDAFHAPAVSATAWRVLEEILPHTAGIAVTIGLPVRFNHVLFNGACMVVDGRPIGIVAKKYLAGDGIHYEPRWFKPWPSGKQAVFQQGGYDVPMGDLFFDLGGVRVGFEICEDAWVAKRAGSELYPHGIDIILNPSASHFAFGKHEVRRRFVLEGSRAFGVTYVYSNLLGCESGRIIYDGDCLIASGGELRALAPRFAFKPWVLTTAVVDLELTRLKSMREASFEVEVEKDKGLIEHRQFSLHVHNPADGRNGAVGAHWETSRDLKHEEFSRTVALGLFDYLRKSLGKGYVVSLSGGADSSAVSILTALMVHFGRAELGEGFAAALPQVPGLAEAQSSHEAVGALLTCVYQKTKNSTPVTEKAASSIAAVLGARFLLLDVEPLVREYVKMVEGATGHHFSWAADDLALQNVQARVRSPGVWLVANERGALLLTTSNRSEAAVGYATMDGDTSGGLCPIGGIDKAFIREWLRWMERKGPQGAWNVPALSLVNAQAPTAELRPVEAKQTDEADLMPYDVLDLIERLAIRDRRMPLEIFLMVRGQLRCGDETLKGWIDRFFRLWSRNQWKRERYAPSFHLDDENLDPKTWCRFPILSGGYQRELKEMWEYKA